MSIPFNFRKFVERQRREAEIQNSMNASKVQSSLQKISSNSSSSSTNLYEDSESIFDEYQSLISEVDSINEEVNLLRHKSSQLQTYVNNSLAYNLKNNMVSTFRIDLSSKLYKNDPKMSKLLYEYQDLKDEFNTYVSLFSPDKIEALYHEVDVQNKSVKSLFDSCFDLQQSIDLTNDKIKSILSTPTFVEITKQQNQIDELHLLVHNAVEEHRYLKRQMASFRDDNNEEEDNETEIIDLLLELDRVTKIKSETEKKYELIEDRQQNEIAQFAFNIAQTPQPIKSHKQELSPKARSQSPFDHKIRTIENNQLPLNYRWVQQSETAFESDLFNSKDIYFENERTQIRVGIFHQKISKKLIMPYFVQFGKVYDIYIDEKDSKFYFIVTFKKNKDAQEAINQLNGKILNGTQIYAEWNDVDNDYYSEIQPDDLEQNSQIRNMTQSIISKNDNPDVSYISNLYKGNMQYPSYPKNKLLITELNSFELCSPSSPSSMKHKEVFSSVSKISNPELMQNYPQNSSSKISHKEKKKHDSNPKLELQKDFSSSNNITNINKFAQDNDKENFENINHQRKHDIIESRNIDTNDIKFDGEQKNYLQNNEEGLSLRDDETSLSISSYSSVQKFDIQTQTNQSARLNSNLPKVDIQTNTKLRHTSKKKRIEKEKMTPAIMEIDNPQNSIENNIITDNPLEKKDTSLSSSLSLKSRNFPQENSISNDVKTINESETQKGSGVDNINNMNQPIKHTKNIIPIKGNEGVINDNITIIKPDDIKKENDNGINDEIRSNDQKEIPQNDKISDNKDEIVNNDSSSEKSSNLKLGKNKNKSSALSSSQNSLKPESQNQFSENSSNINNLNQVLNNHFSALISNDNNHNNENQNNSNEEKRDLERNDDSEKNSHINHLENNRDSSDLKAHINSPKDNTQNISSLKPTGNNKIQKSINSSSLVLSNKINKTETKGSIAEIPNILKDAHSESYIYKKK